MYTIFTYYKRVCVYKRVTQWMRIETKGISSISHFILFRHRWQNLQAFCKWICLNRTWFDYQLQLFLPFLHFEKMLFLLVLLCRISKHESNARGRHMWESVTTLTVRWHKHEPFHMFNIRNGNTNRTCTEIHTKRGRSKISNNNRSHTFAPIYLFSRTNSLNHNYSSFIWKAFDERSVYTVQIRSNTNTPARTRVGASQVFRLIWSTSQILTLNQIRSETDESESAIDKRETKNTILLFRSTTSSVFCFGNF